MNETDETTTERYALSSGHFSTDDQIADVLSWMSSYVGRIGSSFYPYAVSLRFVAEFPEYNGLTWSGSWVDAEASGVDPEFMSWVADWIENNTPVYWEEGEPWIDSDD